MANELAVKVKVQLDATQKSLKPQLDEISEYSKKNPVKVALQVDKKSLENSLKEAFGTQTTKKIKDKLKEATDVGDVGKGSFDNFIKEAGEAQNKAMQLASMLTKLYSLMGREKSVSQIVSGFDGKSLKAVAEGNYSGLNELREWNKQLAAIQSERAETQNKILELETDPEKQYDFSSDERYLNLQSQINDTINIRTAKIQDLNEAMDNDAVKNEAKAEEEAINAVVSALERKNRLEVQQQNELKNGKQENADQLSPLIDTAEKNLEAAKKQAKDLGIEIDKDAKYTEALEKATAKLNIAENNVASKEQKTNDTKLLAEKEAAINRVVDATKRYYQAQVEQNKAIKSGDANSIKTAGNDVQNQQTNLREAISEANKLGAEWKNSKKYADELYESKLKLEKSNNDLSASQLASKKADDAKTEKAAIDSIVESLNKQTEAQIAYNNAKANGNKNNEQNWKNELDNSTKELENAKDVADNLGVAWKSSKKYVDAYAESTKKINNNTSLNSDKEIAGQQAKDISQQKDAINAVVKATNNLADARVKYNAAAKSENADNIKLYGDEVNRDISLLADAKDAADKLGAEWRNDAQYLEAYHSAQVKVAESNSNLAAAQKSSADREQKANDAEAAKNEADAINAVVKALEKKTQAQVEYNKYAQTNDTRNMEEKYYEQTKYAKELADAEKVATTLNPNWRQKQEYLDACDKATAKMAVSLNDYANAQDKALSNQLAQEQASQEKELTAAVREYIAAAKEASKYNVGMINASSSGRQDNIDSYAGQMVAATEKMGAAAEKMRNLGVEPTQIKEVFDVITQEAGKSEIATNNLNNALQNLQAKDIQDAIGSMADAMDRAAKAESAMYKAHANGDSTAEAEQMRQLGLAMDEVAQRADYLNQHGIDPSQFTELSDKAQSWAAKAGSAYDSMVESETRAKATTDQLNSSIDNTISRAKALNESMQKNSTSADLTGFNDAYKEFNDIAQNTSGKYSDLKTKSDALRTAYQKMGIEAKNVKDILKDQSDVTRTATNFANLNAQISRFLSSNPGVSRDSGLYSQFQKLSVATQQCNGNISELRMQEAQLEAQAESLGLTTESLGSKISRLFKDHFQTAFVMAGIHMIQQGFQQVYQNVSDVDAAMTELKKVTDETDSTYNTYMQTAIKQSRELASSISDTVNATADFARLGYTLDQATELSKAAITYQHVGDGISDISEATESIISTMKAFNITAEDSITIVDKFNKVGNEFAISSSGVGEALQRSASALKAAGNDIDQSIGMIVAANDVAQDPEQVGNALRVVALRIRGTKTELEAAGESTEGMATSTAKLRDELKGLAGVDIMETNNAFKSTYDILDQLAAKWKDLDDITQAGILEKIAGKNRANVVAGMLENWEDAKAAADAARDSYGSAEAELDKYKESIAGLNEQLKASFGALSENLLDDNLVKIVLKLATGVSDVTNSVVELTGVLPLLGGALTSAFAIGTSSKTLRNIKSTLDGTAESAIAAAQQLSKIPSVLQGFESIGLNKVSIGDSGDLQNYIANLSMLDQNAQSAADKLVVFSNGLANTAQFYKEGVANGSLFNSKLYEQQLASTSLSDTIQKQILQQSKLIDSEGKYTVVATSSVQTAVEGTAAFKTLGAAEQTEVTAAIAATTAKQKQTVATRTLTAAQSALNVALSIGKQLFLGIGVSLAITAITAGVTKLVEKFKELNPTLKDLTENAQKAKTEYDSAETSLEEYKNQLDELIEKKKLVAEGKITDASEISEIDTQNEYIRAQIKLYEDLLDAKAKVANSNAMDAANAKTYISANQDYNVEDDPNGVGVGYTKYVDAGEHLDELIGKYDDLNSSLSDLSQGYRDGTVSESDYISKSSELGSQMDSVKDQITDTYNEISTNFNSAIDDGSELYGQLKEKTDAATEAYLNFQDAIGMVTEKQEEMNEGLEDSWKTDTPSELAQFMESLSDSSSDLYSKTKALTSAYNDMYQNQRLSSDSIQKLISEYPDLINQMETENGVTTINKDILSEKFETIKSSMVATIESEIQATQTAINQAQQRIAIYQNEIKILTALYSSIGMIASEVKAGTYGANEEYGPLTQEQLDAANRYIEMTDGISEMEQTIKDANAQLADQKKSLDLLNNLTLPNYAGATKGASSANKGATQAAKENKKALEAQKKEAEKTKKALENYSKTLKAQGDAIIKVLDKRKDALEKEKDAKDKAWDKEKDQLEEQKKLQDKVYDQQKEALEEKKKALQDANDEEDRAIKLAQLQDELAKAQSQRTKRVYQHDTGFEWQVDESAVSDAQNNLDDQQRTWKREDAINAVEKEIDAIEKLKDAYDDEVDAAIDAIEKQKDAYDESIEAQIDKIEEMKDKYQEVLDIIGMSWDEYQAMLDATAMAEGMSLDSMGEYLVGFKDDVVNNLKQISDAEAEVQRLTDAISGIDTSSSGSGGGAVGGGFAGLSTSLSTTSQKLQELASQIIESTVNISALKSEEEALCDKLSNGNLTTSERVDAMTKLGAVQSDISDEEANLTDLAGQYVIALGEETDATDEFREAALLQLQTLTDGYNVNYEAIFTKLQDYLDKTKDTELGTSESYDSMSSTVDLFATNVSTSLDGLGGNFDTLVEKVQKAAEEIEKTCKSAIENIKAMKDAADNDSGGSHHAIGSRGIQRSGRSIVDEEGPELIVHQSMGNGRYTYLERGDQVLPASYSKNLWDMGSNPTEWFEKQYSKFARTDMSKPAYVGTSTVYSPTFTGDIVITNPVGNSNDLARSLKQNLPASFMQAIGVKL